MYFLAPWYRSKMVLNFEQTYGYKFSNTLKLIFLFPYQMTSKANTVNPLLFLFFLNTLFKKLHWMLKSEMNKKEANLDKHKTWSLVSNSSLSKTFAFALILLVPLVTDFSAKSPWIVYASNFSLIVHPLLIDFGGGFLFFFFVFFLWQG